MEELRTYGENDWRLVVVLVVVALLAVVKNQEPKRFQLLVRMLASRSSMVDMFALDGNVFNWFGLLLSTVHLATLSLIGLLSLEFFFPQVVEVGWKVFLLCFGGLAAFVWVKRIVGLLIAYVVEQGGLAKKYFLFKELQGHLIGLLLLPLAIVYMYAPFAGEGFMLFLLGSTILLYVLSYGRMLYTFVFEQGSLSYHLFVYLCALEILPLLVMVKVATGWIG